MNINEKCWCFGETGGEGSSRLGRGSLNKYVGHNWLMPRGQRKDLCITYKAPIVYYANARHWKLLIVKV